MHHVYTLSVPISSKLLRALNDLVTPDMDRNALIRVALERYIEDQAVEAVLKAEKEPRLEGDLETLVAQIDNL